MLLQTIQCNFISTDQESGRVEGVPGGCNGRHGPPDPAQSGR